MEPAIATVEKMMGVWQAIGEDLANLQQMATSNVGTLDAAVAEIIDEKLTERWAELAVAGKFSSLVALRLG